MAFVLTVQHFSTPKMKKSLTKRSTLANEPQKNFFAPILDDSQESSSTLITG